MQTLTTKDLARSLGVQSETIRRGLCTNGHYMGLKPIKLPNRRLVWREEDLRRLLDEK